MTSYRLVGQLPKYYYKPILEKIQEAYLSNAQKDYEPGFDIESNVRIVIDAPNDQEAEDARIGFVDIRMWELEKTED
jgi:hypothetical protein